MAMLVTAMLTPQVSPAVAAGESDKPSVMVTRAISVSPAISDIQYQKFISYLSQEYAPELKAEWVKAFAERKSIQTELSSKLEHDMAFAASDIKVGDWYKVEGDSKGLSVEMKAVEASSVSNSLDPNNAKNTAIVLNKAEYESKSATAAIKALPAAIISGTEANPNEEICVSICTVAAQVDEDFSTQLKLQDELDQAITSNNGQTIQAALGKMLSNYKQVTEDMKNSLSKE